MKITYDPYVDALYLYFNNKKIVNTVSQDQDIIIDYSDNNIPVGMEILSVSKKTSPKALGSINFELNTEKPSPLISGQVV